MPSLYIKHAFLQSSYLWMSFVLAFMCMIFLEVENLAAVVNGTEIGDKHYLPVDNVDTNMGNLPSDSDRLE